MYLQAIGNNSVEDAFTNYHMISYRLFSNCYKCECVKMYKFQVQRNDNCYRVLKLDCILFTKQVIAPLVLNEKKNLLGKKKNK